MEWTQTEVSKKSESKPPVPAQQGGKGQGGKKSIHISELSLEQLQNVGRK